jgi:hypothetical protein
LGGYHGRAGRVAGFHWSMRRTSSEVSMGTMVRRVTVTMMALAILAPMTNAATVGTTENDAAAPPQRDRGAAISGGHDKKSAWLVADYRELHLRKRTDRTTKTTVIELRAGNDLVTVTVVNGSVSVSRNSHAVVLDSAEAMESLQHLLGGSLAVFATRAMLSELESSSALKAPDMSLLAAAAYVASLVGDLDAPRRIADRFVEKHRGIYRQVRANGTCWGEYTTETTAAWDDLQACMADANEKSFFRAAYERIACNTIWLGRSESAWFEYLNCLSPLSALNQ